MKSVSQNTTTQFQDVLEVYLTNMPSTRATTCGCTGSPSTPPIAPPLPPEDKA